MILVALTHGFKFQILIWALGKLRCERNLSANPSLMRWSGARCGIAHIAGSILMSATHLILPQKGCRSGPFLRYKYCNFLGQKWHDVNTLMWVLMKSTSAMISCPKHILVGCPFKQSKIYLLQFVQVFLIICLLFFWQIRNTIQFQFLTILSFSWWVCT